MKTKFIFTLLALTLAMGLQAQKAPTEKQKTTPNQQITGVSTQNIDGKTQDGGQKGSVKHNNQHEIKENKTEKGPSLEKRSKVEERSNGHAFSGKGKGVNHNLKNPEPQPKINEKKREKKGKEK